MTEERLYTRYMTKGSADDGVVFHAGFPNAAEDGKFGSLNLDSLIVRHRSSTFFWRLEQEIPQLQWSADDVVVVDRSLTPKEGSLVVVVADDEFVVARFHQKRIVHLDGSVFLEGATVWGTVTYVVHKL